MHSRCESIEAMTYENANEVIEYIFESFFSRYQVELESSKKGSNFIFDGVNLMHFKCHKVNFKRSS